MGGPCSRADKLKAALQIHLPHWPDSSNANMKMMSRLLECVQRTWGIDLGMQKRPDIQAMIQGCSQEVVTAKQDTPVVDSSTFSSEPCHEEDPYGGEVVGGLDGDYAYGSYSLQTS